MYLAYIWAENIFLLTMQAILVIRVYALFNQSKKLLIFLATFYALQATAVFVLSALEFNNRAQLEYVASVGPAIGSVVQDVSVNSSSAFLRLGEGSTILSVVFDTVLLFFSLWAFVRHTFEAKTLNGGWSINLLVRTLVADHLVYFVCYLIWLSLSLATTYVTEATVSNAMLDMLYVFNALAAVAGPRMVIGLRAMENKTRGEGGTLEGEVSTIRFGVREPPTQSVSVMEQGDEFRATDENV
ncbi:hypothetical protein BJ138DRAFT_1116158 [Hygrophoropsis aurantiaca]|uniref:Uncharacterized protein n=1 Tax=Hygrophoropsis aurantiaca TaxID=72124 RepID=A0ACB8A3Z2_9AGAM|nr:hypothetical protein BJ138DRAFT_1116158 [Hygrophoropsis aurantiaca]